MNRGEENEARLECCLTIENDVCYQGAQAGTFLSAGAADKDIYEKQIKGRPRGVFHLNDSGSPSFCPIVHLRTIRLPSYDGGE